MTYILDVFQKIETILVCFFIILFLLLPDFSLSKEGVGSGTVGRRRR